MKYYASLGYKADKVGSIISVYYKDLKRYSEEQLVIKCDYCGNIFNRVACDHFTCSLSVVKMDACNECKTKKTIDVSEQKYGVRSVFQMQDVKDKIKSTLQQKYNVDYISQSPIIKEKIIQSNLQKYGVKSPMSLQATKDKCVATNRERYGVDYYTQTEDYLDKKRKTCIEKYGAPSPMQSPEFMSKFREVFFDKYGVYSPFAIPEVVEKSVKSRYLHGNQTCSKQQLAFFNAIGGELNYAIGRFYIDIALVDRKIAIEYNGSGHDLSVRLGYKTEYEFLRNENFRNAFMKEYGWKTVRFVSKKDIVPSSVAILFLLEVAYQRFASGDNWIEFDLDTNKLKTYNKEEIFIMPSLND